MSSPRLIPIPAAVLPEAWPEVSPMLSALAANSGGCFDASDYAKALIAKDMQLWAAHDDGVVGVMLTEILNYPKTRVANLIGASGSNPHEWAALMPEVERWAKIEGCQKMRAIHRPGWRPLLELMGFKKWHEISEKAL